MNWIFLKFLLPVSDFSANGEQKPEKDTGCQFVVVPCSSQTWDSWLFSFSEAVLVRLHPCTLWAWLLLKQQKQLSLSACKVSTLCALFLYYTTRWRQFCWEYRLAPPFFLTGTENVKATHYFEHSVATPTKPIKVDTVNFLLSACSVDAFNFTFGFCLLKIGHGHSFKATVLVLSKRETTRLWI